MPEVTFYPISDSQEHPVKYAVIAAKYQNQWVFCRHRDRSTWEIPGGHCEEGETPSETARRELWEETGAAMATISPICLYSFSDFGMLYYADIQTLEPLSPESEIVEIRLFDDLPENLTYPHIQKDLFNRVQTWLLSKREQPLVSLT